MSLSVTNRKAVTHGRPPRPTMPADTLLAGEKRVLASIAAGAPITATLDALIAFVEAQEEGLVCGILIVSDDGAHLRRGAGARLPEIYHRTLDGAAITPPHLGACAETAHAGHPIVVPDIAADRRYSETWRKLMLGCGLNSCCSFPVRGVDGRVLASFAAYRREARADPRPTHPDLVEIAIHLAAIALERERDKASQERRNEHMKAMAEATALGIATLTPEGHVLLANPAFCAIVGYSAAELAGMDCKSLIHPDDYARLLPMVAGLVAGRCANFTIEMRYFRKDGATVWMYHSVSFLPADFLPRAPGDPARPARAQLVVHCFESTGQHQAEQALNESERHWRQLLEALPIALYTIDAGGKLTYFNDAAAELAGRRPVLGEDEWCVFRKHFYPDGSPMRRDQCPAAIALKEGRAIVGAEGVGERADGTRVPCLIYPQPLRDETGRLTGVVNTVIDISARKAMEEQLRGSEERLGKDLDAAQRLQAISTLLIGEGDADDLYQKIVEAATAIMQSDSASLQSLNAESGELKQLAICGEFHPRSLAFWKQVRRDGATSCAVALRTCERAIITDVENCDFLAGTRDLEEHRRSRIAASQSTPLLSRTGRLLGMISTHWREPHEPEAAALRSLDVLARQAAELIERQQAEARLETRTLRLEALNRIARALAHEHDIERITEIATASAVELTEAQYGAFFYNRVNGDGKPHFELAALAGAPREVFEKLGLPSKSPLFHAIFHGDEAIVRAADITRDPRYGHNPPHFGLPAGHPPIASYLSVPVFNRRGEVLGGLFLGHQQASMFDDNDAALIVGLAAHAATAMDGARLIEALEAELGHSQRNERAAQQLAAIVTSSYDAIARTGMTGTIETWNYSAETLTGYTAEEVIGRPITLLSPRGQKDEESAILERIRRGESLLQYETERRHKDGSIVPISLTISPIYDDAGNIIGQSRIARDISLRRAAEAHRELLMHELSHRVKNTLATAQAISTQTLANIPSPEAFQRVFLGRLAALAHTHDVLTANDWQGASFAELARLELSPYGKGKSDRWTLHGEDLQLNPRMAPALGMALHELATNAAKYGAFSVPEGRVELRWENRGAGADARLRIEWIERGGPPVAKPERHGFGSRIIERGLKHELDAEARLAFEPAGLRCTIELPFPRPPVMETA